MGSYQPAALPACALLRRLRRRPAAPQALRTLLRERMLHHETIVPRGADRFRTASGATPLRRREFFGSDNKINAFRGVRIRLSSGAAAPELLFLSDFQK
jgi:hypothetical protein